MTIKHRVISSARVGLLTAVLCVGCGGDRQARELDARAEMAAALARAIPPERAREPLRVIANPYIEKSGVSPDAIRYHRAVLRGLATGLGRAIRAEEIVFPPLRPGAWEQPERFLMGRTLRTPLTALMTPDAFDALVAAHPDARLFISAVGVPEGLHHSPVWTNANAPALALYLPDFNAIPDPSAWRRAFEKGRVVAAVIEQAGYPAGRVLSGADDAAAYWPRAKK